MPDIRNASSLLPRVKRLLVVIDVNDSLRPLASWDLALEHDVDLAVGTSLHLRKLVVRRDQAEEAGSAPNVAAFASNCSVSVIVRYLLRGGEEDAYGFRQ